MFSLEYIKTKSKCSINTEDGTLHYGPFEDLKTKLPQIKFEETQQNPEGQQLLC